MVNYDRKYSREELWNMDPVSVYKIVLYGKYNKIFPKNYWDRPDCLNLCKEIVRFLIEEQLRWFDEDIKENLSIKTFADNGLNGMLQVVFKGSSYAVIDNAYPDRFRPWELSCCGRNYWNKNSAKEATIWLIEKKLKWSEEDIKENLSTKTFDDNGLSGMLDVVFKDSPYATIDNAYPGKFHPWEFSNCPSGFWNKDTAKEATIWLIEEQLKWSDKDIKENLSIKTFYNNGLRGMLKQVFKDSPYATIDNAYPGKFHPWEFSNCPSGFWNKDTAKEATIWLIEEQLKWSDKDIKENLSIKTFVDNGLRGMLDIVFKSSPYVAINNIYPGKFYPWELSNCPSGFWNKDVAKKATVWLIEERLKWSDEDIKENLSTKTFYNNGLRGMLDIVFNGSPYAVIDNAYPGKFKRTDLKGYK